MYAYDLAIYCQTNTDEATVIRGILQRYCKEIGLKINQENSSIHYNINVSHDRRTEIEWILGMKECKHDEKYLGHSFYRFHSRAAGFDNVIEKMASKLSGWKQKFLSMAGRLTLANSVLQAIPTFIMQMFQVLQSRLKKMEVMTRRFVWGVLEDKQHHMYLKSWETLCQPKMRGSLGVRKMDDINKAFMMKLAWNVCVALEKTWVKLIKVMYLRGHRILDVEQTSQTSFWIWGT